MTTRAALAIFLWDLRRRGIVVEPLAGGRLRIGPRRRLTPQDKQFLRGFRCEIGLLLRELRTG